MIKPRTYEKVNVIISCDQQDFVIIREKVEVAIMKKSRKKYHIPRGNMPGIEVREAFEKYAPSEKKYTKI